MQLWASKTIGMRAVEGRGAHWRQPAEGRTAVRPKLDFRVKVCLSIELPWRLKTQFAIVGKAGARRSKRSHRW